MPRKPPTRNLAKKFTLKHEGSDEVWQRHTHESRHKVAVDEAGKKFKPDRRRWSPRAGGKLNKLKKLTGTAEELYVNKGVEARGTGGKNRKKRKKQDAKRKN